MGKKQQKPVCERLSAGFRVGAISFVFMVVGYQAACFMHRAATLRVVANRDAPDTVYVVDSALAVRLLTSIGSEVGMEGTKMIGDVPSIPASSPIETKRTARAEKMGDALSTHSPDHAAAERTARGVVIRREGNHGGAARQAYRKAVPRRVESFRFNPNTVSLEDLQRLGFSERQAQAIVNYREKGGHFRRKTDFAKSFVVADSVYSRLEPFIDIPRVDLNRADSAAFDALPGIGPYLASRMVSYRDALGGYDCAEQLLNIYRFDEERFAGLCDLIACSPVEKPDFWSLTVEELRAHPDVRSWSLARAIILFRDNNPPERHTPRALLEAGVLNEEQALRLGRCVRQKD